MKCFGIVLGVLYCRDLLCNSIAGICGDVAAFWSCQLDESPSNATLAVWENAGGVSVKSGNEIVQVIHKALSTPSAVAKVSIPFINQLCNQLG